MKKNTHSIDPNALVAVACTKRQNFHLWAQTNNVSVEYHSSEEKWVSRSIGWVWRDYWYIKDPEHRLLAILKWK